MSPRIAIDRQKIAEFCRKHHICKLSLFGSVLRKDFRRRSDVDVLVEFDRGHTPGFSIVSMEDELSAMLRRKVDLRTPAEISRHFRDEVLAEAEVQYVKTL